MAGEIASAFVSLVPSARGFGSKLNSEVAGETQSAGRRVGAGFGRALVAGALVVAAGLTALIGSSIGDARESVKIQQTTAQVIKATGGAANLTASQVGNLSGALSNKIGVDDELIQTGANLLLTFKNVRNEAGKGADIFTRATTAGADLAAVGFGSIESNAKTLGKALNDPTKGITALTRAGVTFTEGQKEQIAGFVETGNLLGAQKIILGEVENQVGGVAAATATSTEKAKVAFGNLKEDLGTKLLPVVDRVADAFVGFAPKIGPGLSKVGDLFGRLQAFFAPFVAQVIGFFRGDGGSAIKDFADQVLQTFNSQVLPVLQQVAGFIAANFMPTVQRIADVVRNDILPVYAQMATTFTGTVLPAITSLVSYVATALYPVFLQIAGIVVDKVIPIIASLATFFYGTLYPAIVNIVAAVAQNLKPVFDQLVATMQTQVLPTVSKLLDQFREAQPTIQKVVLIVVKIIGTVLKFAAAVLGKVLPVVIRLAGFLISKLVPAVVSVIGFIVKVIGKAIDFGQALVDVIQFAIQFQKGVFKAVGKVLDFIGKIPSKIKGFFSDAGTLLKTIGGQIIDGLKKGIEAGVDKVMDVVNGLIDKIPKFIRDKLGISSPSKVTHYLGEMISQGLANGIAAKGSAVEKATQKLIEKLESKLSGVRDIFDNVSSSVAGAFGGDFFSAETASGFLTNLLDTKGQLKSLKAAFAKLLGWGLKPEFLSQLFQSGNAGLILDLAAGSKAQATTDAGLFNDVVSLQSSLGVSVADALVGDKLDSIEKAIQDLRKDGKSNAEHTGKRVGQEINSAARAGYRRAA